MLRDTYGYALLLVPSQSPSLLWVGSAKALDVEAERLKGHVPPGACLVMISEQSYYDIVSEEWESFSKEDPRILYRKELQ